MVSMQQMIVLCFIHYLTLVTALIFPDFTNATLSFRSGDVYLNDDVPFSCCDATHQRPCIHHHVHDNTLHYNYDFRTGVTLYKIGCTDALMSYYGKRVLLYIGLLLMALSFLELVLLIMTRILQTSIGAALQADDVEGISIGFLFPFGPAGPEQKVQKDDYAEENKPLLQQADDQTLGGETPDDANMDTTFDSEFDDIDEEEPIPTAQPNEYSIDPVINNVDQPHVSAENIYSNIGSLNMINRGGSMTHYPPNPQPDNTGHYEEFKGGSLTHYPLNQQPDNTGHYDEFQPLQSAANLMGQYEVFDPRQPSANYIGQLDPLTPNEPIYENIDRFHRTYTMPPEGPRPDYNDYNVSAISSSGRRRNTIPLRFPVPPSRTYFDFQRNRKYNRKCKQDMN